VARRTRTSENRKLTLRQTLLAGLPELRSTVLRRLHAQGLSGDELCAEADRVREDWSAWDAEYGEVFRVQNHVMTSGDHARLRASSIGRGVSVTELVREMVAAAKAPPPPGFWLTE
jgi:hypothetical protein